MDNENQKQYKSQIFFDGDVLTADEMNNIIAGIDECMEKVPEAPPENGAYFLSATVNDPQLEYSWVPSDVAIMYRDPQQNGNIIIGSGE